METENKEIAYAEEIKNSVVRYIKYRVAEKIYVKIKDSLGRF